MNTQIHNCGGTVLVGGSGEQRHIYCDRCGAFTHDTEAELPTGTDKAANRKAYDDGAHASPDADDDETGAPNLDAMPRDELLEWAAAGARRTVKVGRTLFPARPKGYVRATNHLVNYASNKAAAMYCREHGDITGAQIYEIICDRIYDRLPTFARW